MRKNRLIGANARARTAITVMQTMMRTTACIIVSRAPKIRLNR
jgi:hypothetical protein